MSYVKVLATGVVVLGLLVGATVSGQAAGVAASTATDPTPGVAFDAHTRFGLDDSALPFDVSVGDPAPLGTPRAGESGRGLLVDVQRAVFRDRWTSETFGAGHDYAAVSFDVMLPSLPQSSAVDGQWAGIFTSKNDSPSLAAGNGNFDMGYNPATGHFVWDLLAADSSQSTMAVQAGVWYRVRTTFHFGSAGYAAQVSIQPQDQPEVQQASIASEGVPDYAVKSVGFGTDSVLQSYVYQVDNVHLIVGDVPLPFAS